MSIISFLLSFFIPLIDIMDWNDLRLVTAGQQPKRRCRNGEVTEHSVAD